MSILSQVLRRPGSFYILKSSHHAMRKPKQPCEEAHVKNKQDPCLSFSWALSQEPAPTCQFCEWAILKVYPPAIVKILQLVTHETEISWLYQVVSKFQNHCCFRQLRSEEAYYIAIDNWNAELPKVTQWDSLTSCKPYISLSNKLTNGIWGCAKREFQSEAGMSGNVLRWTLYSTNSHWEFVKCQILNPGAIDTKVNSQSSELKEFSMQGH